MSVLAIHLARVPMAMAANGSPFRASWSLLNPQAARSFELLGGHVGKPVRIAAMFRSPEQSLIARADKTGIQAPGFSAHNFGLAIDIAVEEMMTAIGCDKLELDRLMQTGGWYCHRRDGRIGPECWHYNFLGPDREARVYLELGGQGSNTSQAIEGKIRSLYASGFTVNTSQLQTALKKLRLYRGEIDGHVGPRTRAAIQCFQQAWSLPPTGEPDERTQRTLAVVSADLVVNGRVSG